MKVCFHLIINLNNNLVVQQLIGSQNQQTIEQMSISQKKQSYIGVTCDSPKDPICYLVL